MTWVHYPRSSGRWEGPGRARTGLLVAGGHGGTLGVAVGLFQEVLAPGVGAHLQWVHTVEAGATQLLLGDLRGGGELFQAHVGESVGADRFGDLVDRKVRRDEFG